VRLYPHTDEEISQYSWDEFIAHTVYVSNIQGSALYDASLGDPELIDEMFEDAKKKQSTKRVDRTPESRPDEIEWRPSRRGYSREVEAIYDLTSNIVALRGELGRWPSHTTERQMPKRPWMPAELVEEMMRARSRRERDDRIARAQQRDRERQEAASNAG
jgi:hypothetical protein